jgi:hypothetical protein
MSEIENQPAAKKVPPALLVTTDNTRAAAVLRGPGKYLLLADGVEKMGGNSPQGPRGGAPSPRGQRQRGDDRSGRFGQNFAGRQRLGIRFLRSFFSFSFSFLSLSLSREEGRARSLASRFFLRSFSEVLSAMRSLRREQRTPPPQPSGPRAPCNPVLLLVMFLMQ